MVIIQATPQNISKEECSSWRLLQQDRQCSDGVVKVAAAADNAAAAAASDSAFPMGSCQTAMMCCIAAAVVLTAGVRQSLCVGRPQPAASQTLGLLQHQH